MIAREQIVAAARASMGTPYHHQASVKGAAANAATPQAPKAAKAK
jgi:hypothetical protein